MKDSQSRFEHRFFDNMVDVQAFGVRQVDGILGQIQKGKAHHLGNLTEVKCRTQQIVRSIMDHGFY